MLPSIWSENLFDEFFDNTFAKPFFGGRDPMYGTHAKNLMKTDVKETDSTYEMDIDLPGFKKDEVNVKLDGGYLTISAAKSASNDQKDENGRYIRQERYSGQCSRSFYVGDIRPEDVTAKYEDGILRLAFPKMDRPQLPNQKQIAIQ